LRGAHLRILGRHAIIEADGIVLIAGGEEKADDATMSLAYEIKNDL